MWPKYHIIFSDVTTLTWLSAELVAPGLSAPQATQLLLLDILLIIQVGHSHDPASGLYCVSSDYGNRKNLNKNCAQVLFLYENIQSVTCSCRTLDPSVDQTSVIQNPFEWFFPLKYFVANNVPLKHVKNEWFSHVNTFK